MRPTEITGQVATGFQRVADVFEENLASRGEVGAGVSVMAGGDLVVDLYGGVTYTVNQMGPATPADARSVALVDAVVGCLG